MAAFHRVYVPIHRNEHIAAAALRADKIWCATASTQRGAHTSLFNAAALGLLDRVQQNLESQLSPEQITHALWAACHGGQTNRAAYLLDRCADINWIAPWDGHTPLDAARRNGFDELVAKQQDA